MSADAKMQDKGKTGNGGKPLLTVDKLSAGYGGEQVLREISFEVRRAEIVALVGSNGAGKTTTLRALSRVIGSTGTVTFDGKTTSAMSPEDVFGIGLVQVPEGRQLSTA